MWNKLNLELDKWADQGLIATFWWRDDDAVKATVQLERLIEESALTKAPVLLAVIPRCANLTLKQALTGHDHVVIAQHGYAHVNHAPRGQGLGAWELGLHRTEQAVMIDLKKGYQILATMFEDRFIPVVVPPWNRIDPGLFEPMSKFGYSGVSTFGPCTASDPDYEIHQVNCHCDPIKWKGGARFTGEEKAIAMICEHLAIRRKNSASSGEPTGLLTHHLDMDEQSWSFVIKLGEILNQHPAAIWCDPKTIFHINQ